MRMMRVAGAVIVMVVMRMSMPAVAVVMPAAVMVMAMTMIVAVACTTVCCLRVCMIAIVMMSSPVCMVIMVGTAAMRMCVHRIVGFGASLRGRRDLGGRKRLDLKAERTNLFRNSRRSCLAPGIPRQRKRFAREVDGDVRQACQTCQCGFDLAYAARAVHSTHTEGQALGRGDSVLCCIQRHNDLLTPPRSRCAGLGLQLVQLHINDSTHEDVFMYMAKILD